MAKIEKRSYRRILIVRLDRIGDVALSTPVVKAVKEAYPESYVAVMVGPHGHDIMEGNPYLDEVIVYDKKGLESGPIGNVRFLIELYKRKFDIAIILHPTVRTHILMLLACIPVRVGYDKKMGFLLTDKIPHKKQLGLKHEIDYTLDIIRYLGIEPKDRKIYVPVNKESESRVASLLEHNGVGANDRIVVVNPTASCPSKRWNIKNFAKVSDLLSKNHGVKVVVIASAKDKPFVDKLISLAETKPIDVSGFTTVGDIAALLKRSKLLVSNDSGPVHIACGVGTPVISIFGRSDRGLSPERWGPTGPRDVVLHKDVGCETCDAHNCELGFKCLEAITVDEVMAAAERLLKG